MATASDDTHHNKISLRVLIDSERNRFLFVEAGSDFVDVLFSFLTLPLGTEARLLEKHFGREEGTVGSFNSMRDGLEKLDKGHFSPETAKLMLLNPKNPLEKEFQKLKINIDDTEPSKYFICQCADPSDKFSSLRVTSFNVTRCADCGMLMNKEIKLNASKVSQSEGAVVASGLASFIVTEDLQVLPGSSTLELLNTLGIKDMSAVDVLLVHLGSKEIIQLLKLSMFSKNPLSQLILNTKQQRSVSLSSIGSEPISYKPSDSGSTMEVKVVLQKSTNKILFAQVQEDFVEFLFGMLVIPLGSALSRVGGDDSPGSVYNLYKSISCLDQERCLLPNYSDYVSDGLLCPRLPPHHLIRNNVFSLGVAPEIPLLRKRLLFKDEPKLSQRFVQPAMYMVTDDLVVTPLTSTSCFSILKSFNISPSDIKEVVLNIGSQEAFGILRASLSSSLALTKGLNLKSEKQPKQEA